MLPLAPSTKHRLIRNSQKLIAHLEDRLGTCDLRDFQGVKDALNAERAALKIISAAPEKSKQRKAAR